MFRILVILLILSLVSVAASYGQMSRDLAGSYYHYSLARMYHLREDYSRAVTEFESAIAANPSSSSLRTEFAKTLLQMGDVSRAVEACRSAIDLDPESVEANYLLGRIFYSSRGQNEMRQRALDQFLKVLDIDPDHSRALQDAAELFFEARQYEKAVELFARLREVSPSLIRVYFYEAQALIEMKYVDRAIEILERGLSIRDDIPEYLLLLGDLYRQRGEPERAVELYQLGLSHGPENRLNEALARTLVSLGRGAEAIPALERLTAMLPKDVDLKMDLARAYRQADQMDKSYQVFEALAEENPDSVQINYEFANLLVQMGEAERAAQKFEDLLDSRQPGAKHFRPIFLTNLALIRENQGRDDEAINLFKQAAEASPENLDAQIRLYYAYQRADRTEEAAELSSRLLEQPDRLRKGIQKAADPEMLYLASSQLYMSCEDYTGALELVEEGLVKFPDSERLRFQLGAIHERSKNYEAAEQQFRQVLGRNPDHADVLNYLGYMLAELGVRLGEALGYVQRAVELDPKNGAYLDSLGWVYFKQDDLKNAETHLKRAAEINRSDPVILEHLGDLYAKKGDVEEAERFYRESIRFAEKEEESARVKKKLDQLIVPTSGR